MYEKFIYIMPVQPGQKVKFIEVFYNIDGGMVETRKYMGDIDFTKEYTIESIESMHDTSDYMYQLVKVSGIPDIFGSVFLNIPRVEIQKDEVKRLIKKLATYL